jgi:hypothetical protein
MLTMPTMPILVVGDGVLVEAAMTGRCCCSSRKRLNVDPRKKDLKTKSQIFVFCFCFSIFFFFFFCSFLVMSTVIVIPQRALESAVTKLLEEERQPPQETPIETSKKRKAAEPAEENEDEVVERAAGLTEANARNNHDTAPVIEQAVVPTQPDNAVAATAAAAAARPRARQGSVACVIEGCSVMSVSEQRMRRHVRDAHHGGRYRCPLYDQCGRDYSNMSAMSQHMFVTHGATRIQCPAVNCDRIFHSLETLARHGARFHPELARDIFLATRRTRNGEAALPAPGSVTAAGSQITSEMFVNAGVLVRLNLASLDRIAWADRQVDAVELERIDKQAPPYEFPCPWPNCTHVAQYRTELRQHYIALHRTALGDTSFEFKEASPGVLLDATTLAWAPPMSFTVTGPYGARVVPLPVSRGHQGHDTVGVSRVASDWTQPAGMPTATAAPTEEMQRIDSALHCPAALAAGPVNIPQLRYVSAFVAPRVLENPKPIPPNLRPQHSRSAFKPFGAAREQRSIGAIAIASEPSV